MTVTCERDDHAVVGVRTVAPIVCLASDTTLNDIVSFRVRRDVEFGQVTGEKGTPFRSRLRRIFLLSMRRANALLSIAKVFANGE